MTGHPDENTQGNWQSSGDVGHKVRTPGESPMQSHGHWGETENVSIWRAQERLRLKLSCLLPQDLHYPWDASFIHSTFPEYLPNVNTGLGIRYMTLNEKDIVFLLFYCDYYLSHTTSKIMQSYSLNLFIIYFPIFLGCSLSVWRALFIDLYIRWAPTMW